MYVLQKRRSLGPVDHTLIVSSGSSRCLGIGGCRHPRLGAVTGQKLFGMEP